MIQWFNFAVVKWLIVSPSIITEVKINVGPENKASQATNATGLISLLNGFTTTWPNAQIAEPRIVRDTPKNFPSKSTFQF